MKIRIYPLKFRHWTPGHQILVTKHSEIYNVRMNMSIGDIGEFGVIDSIRSLISACVVPDPGMGHDLILGIGDDGAVWTDGYSQVVATTDTMVEGVHFQHHLISWNDLGWKAITVNVSDIAAMGGNPLYALVTIGLPRDTELESIHDFYTGLLSACKEYGCCVVGGDLVRSPVTFVTIALTGVATEQLLRRDQCKLGDAIAVTGPLGCSAAGLDILLNGDPLEQESNFHLVQCHTRPVARLDAVQILLKNGVNAAMDISDGLVADLQKMCLSSDVDALVYAKDIPVDRFLRDSRPVDYLKYAINGGEDYEILFSGNRRIVEEVVGKLNGEAKIIGCIVGHDKNYQNQGTNISPGDTRVRILDEINGLMTIKSHGWDHFS